LDRSARALAISSAAEWTGQITAPDIDRIGARTAKAKMAANPTI
jgi:hypothetical protein